jgi:hypothetical protein
MVAWQRLPVLKRLVPSLVKHAAWLRWPLGYGATRRREILFLINFKNWADRTLLVNGIFEPDQVNRLVTAIRE